MSETGAKPGRGRDRASAKSPAVVLTTGKAGGPEITVHEISRPARRLNPDPFPCLALLV
ncbi:MAG: hypothetical protein MI863_15695 [Desulfobacterales bacterium]|nr:hypothetical protein [Desulfobacterales bacterium]